MIPPKPASRIGRASLLRHILLFRKDILSANPAHLYRAWMAEYRTPFFRSYLCNDPALVRRVLQERPEDFPKSDRLREGLAPLLGQSVFVTNGALWRRQRRIIDPAFEGGRLREIFPAMHAAGAAAVARLGGEVEVEEAMSHAAADVIFRTLFSIPIEDTLASAVFAEFRAYQRTQPLLNPAALLPLPRWMPRLHRRRTRASAARIRALIARLTEERVAAMARGAAPDDLVTRILAARDPETGDRFTPAEMVDQVAIFFLAGHETSASALAWALYLLATHPEVQERVAAEAELLGDAPDVAAVGRLGLVRDVFRETLRLYPPVPMMVRESRCPETMRGRQVEPGAQIVLSPWHLHRHERLWERPDAFDPDRWRSAESRASAREAFMPFSAGPRVCTGAAFAMIEGPLILAMIARAFRIEPVAGPPPVPVAHLTVRSATGIRLRFTPRG
ncbi:cytochrome P450 [Rhodobacter sp. NSM]|uniref:cytochrome P450 n=1 Tax=Rhodobacter sp. NSM TaxID=3457501 RepID=UPI003FD449A4